MEYVNRVVDLVVQGWHTVGGSAAAVAAFITGLSWISAGIGAVIAYSNDPNYEGQRSFRGFLRFCFPKEILLHRSAKLDYMWVVIHKVTYPFVIAPAITAAVLFGHWARGWAENTFGPPVHAGESWWASFAYTLVALVFLHDFWVFYFHRLEHKIWWLWEFHKTHHAAEAMVWGLTTRRNHPVNEVLQTFTITCLPGLVFGVFAWFWNANVDEVLVFGMSAFYFIKLFTFYHLYHSHIHLRFPAWLEKILVSPAMHQLHHSTDPRHYGRNIGTLFSCWDLMFGSWMRSEPKPVKIGYPEEQEAFSTLWGLYWTPFANIGAELKRRRALRRRRVLTPTLAA
jgi:sterol desaturase/sphingolipid hydroxylase (fatty acid hydroxylase superfamily)